VDDFEWVSKKDKPTNKVSKKEKRPTEDITGNLGESRCSKKNPSIESSGESSDYFLLFAVAKQVLLQFCRRGLHCHSNFVVNVWESRSLDKNHHRIESDNF